MKDLLEYDVGNTTEEYTQRFGSRPGTFFYVLVHKTLTYSVIAAFVVIMYVAGRMYIPSTWLLRVGDYCLAAFSIAYLVFFGHKIVSSWVKSGWRRLPVNYSSLPMQMLKAAAILMVVAAHFVVVYTVSIRCIYEGLCARGQFGDSFGALNSIVSTGALIGVWITLWLQYRQQAEDRMAAIARQREEQKQADDRRRERWPVLVTKQLSGEVSLSGINETGNSLFEFFVKFEVCNCSRCVVLNVSNSVTVHQGNPDDSVFVQDAPIQTYIENKTSNPYSIRFVMTFPCEGNKLEEFLNNQKAIVHIQNVFGTALQFYYSIEEEYILSIENEIEAIPILNAWQEALKVVQHTKNIREGTVVAKNELLSKELNNRNLGKDSIVKLKFRACPQKYKLTEISEAQYLAKLGGKED